MGKVQMTFKAEVSRVYFRRLEVGIYNALDEAVDSTVAYGVAVAKKHAPVRKVTRHGGQRSFRAPTTAEYDEYPDELKAAIDPKTMHFRDTPVASGPRPRQLAQARVVVRRSRASRLDPAIRPFGGRIKRLNTTLPKGEDNSPGGAREVHEQVNWLGDRASRSMANESTTAVLSGRGKAELKGRIKTSLKNPDAVYSHGGTQTLGGRLRSEITGHMLSGPPMVKGIVVSPTEYAKYVEFPTSRTAAQPYMTPARDAMATRLPAEVEKNLNRVVEFSR